MQRFAERYEGYKSGTIDPTYGMNRLSGYLQSGTELYNRLELMKDGLDWSHVTNYVLHSVTLNSVISFRRRQLPLRLHHAHHLRLAERPP